VAHAAEQGRSSEGDQQTGAFDSIKRLGKSLLEAISTRIELFSAEVAEEQGRLAELLLYAVGALLAVFMALGMIAVFVIAMVWDSPNRLQIFGLMAGGFSALAATLFAVLTLKARGHPRLFAASIDQLAMDIERLK
jgi:uncharacterized membrane protein YqjE